MLSPEVCNFKAPESHFLVQKIKPHESNLLKSINKFTFNHLVSVVLPDTLSVPESLKSLLINDCEYYRIEKLNLSELVSSQFVNSFVKSGNLYGLSVNSRIDCDNCIAVTPSGSVILNLTKESYQTLGLEGVVSHFHTQTKDKYIVTIDLKLPHFTPGKPNYERTRKCLEEFPERFDLIFTWSPPGGSICPSSIAKYFADLGYKTYLCETKFNQDTLYSVNIPLITPDVDYYEIVEWLGMISIGADSENSGCEKYLSIYETPEPYKYVGQVKILQWRGLFTEKQISQLLDELKKFHDSHKTNWISMYVQGFSDAPIAWDNSEHHFYTSGDSGYVVIIEDDNFVMCSQKCGSKRYKNKYSKK